jgi:hypothetical protein
MQPVQSPELLGFLSRSTAEIEKFSVLFPASRQVVSFFWDHQRYRRHVSSGQYDVFGAALIVRDKVPAQFGETYSKNQTAAPAQ